MASSVLNDFLRASLMLLLLCVVSEQEVMDRKYQDPYEVPYFELGRTANGRQYTYHKGLKYPPYLRCLVPTRIYTRDSKDATKKFLQKNLGKWRTYWSLIWSRIYFEDEDITVAWDYDRAKLHPSSPTYFTYLGPIFITMIWTTCLISFNIVLYPVIGLCLFRLNRLLWRVVTHRNVKRIIRGIVIKIERSRRNAVIRAYEDAGRHPPFFRYHLPKPIRLSDKDVVPKELDETDEEFWSSDEEGAKLLKLSALKDTTVHPELTPEYQTTKEVIPPISDEVFDYFINMRKHGMFAVWTHGFSDLNLAEISKEHESLYQRDF